MIETCRPARPEIRLMVSDLDGTLLDSAGRIPEANRLAISELGRHGIGFTIATGRMDRMTRAYVRQLDVRLPIIACNGAVIRDCATDRLLWQRCLPRDEALAAVSWLASQGYEYLCYTPDQVYYPEHSRRIELFHRYNRLAEAGGDQPVPLQPMAGSQTSWADGLIKILAVPPDEAALAAMRDWTNGRPALSGVASMTDAFDIMATGVSKGQALIRLAAMLGISMTAVAAAGDNDNDADMLAAAGLGIAMANSTPAAQAASHYVTSRNHDQGGLAEAIESIIS